MKERGGESSSPASTVIVSAQVAILSSPLQSPSLFQARSTTHKSIYHWLVSLAPISRSSSIPRFVVPCPGIQEGGALTHSHICTSSLICTGQKNYFIFYHSQRARAPASPGNAVHKCQFYMCSGSNGYVITFLFLYTPLVWFAL